MVGHTHAFSPKRRRTDDGERTAQQVADTNATLQMFTSRGQRPWMQELSNTARREEGAMQDRQTSSHGNGTILQNAATRDNIMAYGANRDSNANTHPTAVCGTSSPTRAEQTRHETASSLVQYESPAGVEAPTPRSLATTPSSAAGPAPAAVPPPAFGGSAPGSLGNAILVDDGPGAASPRSSHAPTRRPRGRPRGSSVGSGVPRNTGPVQTPLVGSTFAPKRRGRPPKNSILAHAAHNTPTQSPIQVAVPSDSATASPMLPTNTSAPTPTSFLTRAASRNSSTSQTPVAGRSPQQSMQSISPQLLQGATSLFDTARMQQRLDDFSRGSDPYLNQFDHGRKVLLQEAIRQGDMFYLVLSQVFCLYSCNPTDVPASLMRTLTVSSWHTLEQLLCANRMLTPFVLRWFSEFPETIQVVNSSNESLPFRLQLANVNTFLLELPRRWDPLITHCRQRLAPPLTQELVEQLNMTSPVLQTTVFRAIARIIWGQKNDAGYRILEELHKIDQRTHNFQGWRRTEAEKRSAAQWFSALYASWRQWCTNTNRLGAFVAPPVCGNFRRPPLSMHVGEAQPVQQQPNLSTANQRQRVQPIQIASQQQSMNHDTAVTSQGHLPGDMIYANTHFAPTVNTSHGHQQSMYQPVVNSYSPTIYAAGYGPPPHQAHQAARTTMPQLSAPNSRRLLPPENSMPKPLPVQPDTARVSLHQAHLRSPIPGRKTLMLGEQPLYRHVVGFALGPVTLPAQTTQFTASLTQMDSIPTSTPGLLPGEPPIRLLKEGSTLYRLRCAKRPADGDFSPDSSWMTAENVWPDTLAFQLNGHFLEPRRKLHHGRYLPIDITPHLRPGENTLNVYALPNPHDKTPYALAIEIVGVSSHATILARIPTLPAAHSLAAIKRSLTSPSQFSSDEDDFIMTSSTLTIPLFDPFRADRICAVPVRGAACSHRDCFDLETFLSQTRREQPGYPCVPDCWRCPICKGDVRPQTLVKDGFLVEVGEELARRGLLGTRAIVVEADGGWRPKAEVRGSGVRSASLEREEEGAAEGVEGGKGKVVEVIELD